MYTTGFKLDGQGELSGGVSNSRTVTKIVQEKTVTESEKHKGYQ